MVAQTIKYSKHLNNSRLFKQLIIFPLLLQNFYFLLNEKIWKFNFMNFIIKCHFRNVLKILFGYNRYMILVYNDNIILALFSERELKIDERITFHHSQDFQNYINFFTGNWYIRLSQSAWVLEYSILKCTFYLSITTNISSISSLI